MYTYFASPTAGGHDTLATPVDCCSANTACAEFFGERVARRALRRYRSKGLDADARQMVAWADEVGVDGASVLEAGAGSAPSPRRSCSTAPSAR